MFEHQIIPRGASRLPASAAFSVGAHGLIVAMVLVIASAKARQASEAEVQVSFVGPKGAPKAPPPPPPARRRRTIKRARFEVPKQVEIPKVVELPKVIEAPPEPEPDEPDDDGVEGGVEGGVRGGVVGGVVGGVLSGQVGSTGTGVGGGKPPDPPARPKAKNVPAFVIQRSAIRQPMPRLSEIFKQANRGKAGLGGMYKVCVDLDGKVYEVTPIKSVPGADESIIEGIKDYWLFQPQQVPVCFLYNMPITIQ